MIKKLSIALVFVLGTGVLMSASSNKQKIELNQVPGCAGDCVIYARENAEFIAAQTPDLTPTQAFTALYLDCYYGNCY